MRAPFSGLLRREGATGRGHGLAKANPLGRNYTILHPARGQDSSFVFGALSDKSSSIIMPKGFIIFMKKLVGYKQKINSQQFIEKII